MNKEVYSKTISLFQERFGQSPAVVAYAPGRVEVLGNHTDYNEGLVLSAAIDHGTFFAIAPAEGRECRLVAGDILHEVRFDVGAPAPSAEESWSNYCKGVLAGLLPRGRFDKGFNALFLGDIPQGAGLSSSAALEVTTGLAIARLYGIEVSKIDMAKIGQKAEHEFAGVKCGLLDQISSLYGADGMLVKTDFRSLEVENVPLDSTCALLVCKSTARHALVDGAYNERRAACESATAFFKANLAHPVTALRDVSWVEWESLKDKMDPLVASRSAHPIGEDERVIGGSELLAKGDVAGFGELMFASHESSRTLFENSCAELDSLVAIGKATPGVLGARLSGGGFGGSVVMLVKRDALAEAAKAISAAYLAEYGEACETLAITPSAGAAVIKE